MTELEGRTALVTGASRGIGAACARALDQRGARVVLTGRDERTLADVAAGLHNAPAVVVVDLVQPDGPDALVNATSKIVESVDVLVNNAGMQVYGRAEELSAATVDACLALNLGAVIRLSTMIGGAMLRGAGGAIVNISSASATTGVPHHHVYAATKGGVEAFTRALAAEWGSVGVRVNAVAPGVIDTEMTAGVHAHSDLLASVNRTINLRRTGHPDEVAAVVAFLASDAASYLSGEVIAVDGGIARSYHGFPRLPLR